MCELDHIARVYFCGAGGGSRADRLRQRRASTLSTDRTGEPIIIDYYRPRDDLLTLGGTAAMSLGTVKTPTLAQLGGVAAELGLSFSEADLAAHLEALRPSFEAYNILARMPDELPPVAYPRRPGRRPAPEENPNGAWYVKTEVPGAASGKRAGKTGALKVNICLACGAMMQ